MAKTGYFEMSNNEVLLLLVCIMVTILVFMSLILNYISQQEMRIRDNAKFLLNSSNPDSNINSASEAVFFRKRKLTSLLFFGIFLVMLSSAIYGLRFNLGSLNKSGQPFTASTAFIEIFMSLIPLIIAIRQWIYKIYVSPSGLIISVLKTKHISYNEIKEIAIDTVKGSTICTIRLKTGGGLIVGSDIDDFLGFVKRLSLCFNTHSSLAGHLN